MDAEKIKELIAEDEIDKALDALSKYVLGSQSNELEKEFINIKARFSNLKKKNQKGLLTESEFSVRETQVRMNLLDFIDDVFMKETDICIVFDTPTSVEIQLLQKLETLDSAELEQLSDKELMIFIAINDERTTQILYQRYENKALTFLSSLTRKNWQEVREIYDDTFISVINALTKKQNMEYDYRRYLFGSLKKMAMKKK